MEEISSRRNDCFLTVITSEFSQIAPLHCPQASTHFKSYFSHVRSILLHVLLIDLQLPLMNFITSTGAISLPV